MGGKERVDAIGWTDRHSRVLDWKNTQEDAQHHITAKPPVLLPESGVGEYRYLVSFPNVVSADELGDLWPVWLGLIWWDGQSAEEIRSARLHSKFNIFGERRILARYASKANYSQSNHVQAQSFADQSYELIREHGPLRTPELLRLTGARLTNSKANQLLIQDTRFHQPHAGDALRLAQNIHHCTEAT